MSGLVVASTRVKPLDGFSAKQPVNFIPVNLMNVFLLLWLFVGSLNADPNDCEINEFGNLRLVCPLNGLNTTINWTGTHGQHLHTGQVYLTPRITRNMSSIYKCQNSSSSERSFNVTVQYCAEGNISSETMNFSLVEMINISCNINGVPPVSEVAWFLNGTRIDNNSSNITGCPVSSTVSTSVSSTVSTSVSSTVSTSVSTTGTPGINYVEALIISLGVVLGIFLVVAAIGAFLLLRQRRCRCCCTMYCHVFFPSEAIPPDTPTKPRRPSLIGISKYKHGPIPVENFAAHVKLLHMDGDYRFNQEFESLQSVHVKSKSWIHSGKPENQSKNRYNNIVAYDHSRVILSLTENEPDSHYINGNYVDSFKKGNAYIATQGPMANTINDFWRMVWEQNCTVVVMITNIIEKGRHKCAMYWPSKQAKSEVHGPLRVTYLDEETFAHYTLRRFEVKPVEHSTHYSQDASTEEEVKPMIVCQYHFTGWPDHGAPDPGCEYPALDFISKSSAASQDGAGPIIVHCR